jgi:hypothetical protein
VADTKPIVEIFGDESSQNKHKYLVLTTLPWAWTSTSGSATFRPTSAR